MSSDGHFGSDADGAPAETDDDRPVSGDGTDEPVPLVQRVIEQPTGPDRCTIYPPDTSDHVRMTTWISANHRVFVNLEEWR